MFWNSEPIGAVSIKHEVGTKPDKLWPAPTLCEASDFDNRSA